MMYRHHDGRIHLRSVCAAQHGLITSSQARYLLGAGNALSAFADTNQWERVAAGVYRHRSEPVTFEQRCLAAVLDLGGISAIAGGTAARLHGVPIDDSDLIHCSTTTSRRRLGGVVVHRLESLSDRWITLVDAVPTANPALTVLQCFASYPATTAQELFDTLWDRDAIDAESITEVLETFGRRGRTGTGALREQLARHTRPGQPVGLAGIPVTTTAR